MELPTAVIDREESKWNGEHDDHHDHQTSRPNLVELPPSNRDKIPAPLAPAAFSYHADDVNDASDGDDVRLDMPVVADDDSNHEPQGLKVGGWIWYHRKYILCPDTQNTLGLIMFFLWTINTKEPSAFITFVSVTIFVGISQVLKFVFEHYEVPFPPSVAGMLALLATLLFFPSEPLPSWYITLLKPGTDLFTR